MPAQRQAAVTCLVFKIIIFIRVHFMGLSKRKNKIVTPAVTVNSVFWRKAKIGLLFVLLIAGIVMSFHYGLSNMNDNSIREPTIAAADKWLKNADSLKFDVCKETVVDSNGWFEYFKKDRLGLGDFKNRNFKIKSEGGGSYLLIYDIALSKKEKTPPLAEKVTLSRDKSGKYTICGVEYSYPRGIQVWKGSPYEGPDLEIIKQKANVCTLNFDNASIGYFETMFRQADEVQNRDLPQRVYSDRQKRGHPVERQTVKVMLGDKIPGLSAFEHIALINKVTYNIKNKKQIAYEYVLLRKDNLAEKPEWYVYFFTPGQFVKEKDDGKAKK